MSDKRPRFICAGVEQRLAREQWDAVILDPPRQGCPTCVLAAVFEGIALPRAIYVSCNPDEVPGERPVIMNAGYRVERIEAIDMFPHTDHIEAIVRTCSGLM